jgi:glycolate oxidase iron-sulfur subunit
VSAGETPGAGASVFADRALVNDCVRCGFCLPACPTYVLWGREADSPRGRIHLIGQACDGQPLTPALSRHIDLCLGCMGCLTACPSGVRYDRLLEAARPQLERRVRRPLADRAFRALLFRLLPHPGRLRLARAALAAYRALALDRALRATGLARALPDRLRALESLAPQPTSAQRIPERMSGQGIARLRAGLLTGCVQGVFFPHVSAATARVLAAEGVDVVAPRGQGCCGALSLHAGREDEARRLARRTVDAFEAARIDVVVVDAAGCGSVLKEYGRLLRDDPAYADRARRLARSARDVSELLAELETRATYHALPVAVAYHEACHLGHAQRIRRQPRDLLRSIPDLELREVREGELCCGSAGTYNILEPEPAQALGDRKAEAVLAARAPLLATANPGCLLQIRAALERAGRPLALVHVVELLDASQRGVPVDRLLASARSAGGARS